MNVQRVAFLAAAALVAGAAHADVTPIGEFTGEFWENFEDIAPPGGYGGAMNIFGGAGTVADTLANTVVIATSVASADTNWENVYPYNGFLMGLTPTGWTRFTFNTPVMQFGGYFGSAAIQSGGTVTFRDEEGTVLTTLPISIPEMEWNWHGWQSDVPIGSVEIHSSASPGLPLVFDDLQASVVPAPGSLALLAFAGVAASRRRR